MKLGELLNQEYSESEADSFAHRLLAALPKNEDGAVDCRKTGNLLAEAINHFTGASPSCADSELQSFLLSLYSNAKKMALSRSPVANLAIGFLEKTDVPQSIVDIFMGAMNK